LVCLCVKLSNHAAELCGNYEDDVWTLCNFEDRDDHAAPAGMDEETIRGNLLMMQPLCVDGDDYREAGS